jgi:hypothetical protein
MPNNSTSINPSYLFHYRNHVVEHCSPRVPAQKDNSQKLIDFLGQPQALCLIFPFIPFPFGNLKIPRFWLLKMD